MGGQDAIDYLGGKDQYADRAAHELPHFVITDLKMPDVDGFEVLEFLKSRPELAFISAVVFSGSADNDDIRRSYELGAASYHVNREWVQIGRAFLQSTPCVRRTILRITHRQVQRPNGFIEKTVVAGRVGDSVKGK